MRKTIILLQIIFFAQTLSAQDYHYEWSTGLFDNILPNGLAITDITDPSNGIDENAAGVAVDQDGNIITTGFMKGKFYDIATLSSVYETNGSAIFLQKKTPEGEVIWSRYIDGGTHDIPSAGRISRDIAVDSENNIYICGRINDTTDFDPGPGEFLVIPQVYFAGFIAKYTPSGELDFVYLLEGGTDAEPRDIAIDKDDNIVVAGIYEKTVDFDGGPGVQSSTSNSSIDDNFLLKINSSGQYLWHKTWGGQQPDDTDGLEIDENGNCYVVCLFSTPVDTDPGVGINILETPPRSPGGGNVSNSYLSKFDASGNWKWSTLFKSNYSSNLIDLAIEEDKIGVIGTYAGALEVGQTDSMHWIPEVSPGWNENVFVIQLDSDGQFNWNYSPQAMNSPIYSYGEEIAGHNGAWFVRFNVANSADIDNGPNEEIVSNSFTTQYIVKLSEDGMYQWNKKFELDARGYLELHEIKTTEHDMYIVGHYSDGALDANPDPNETDMLPMWYVNTLMLIKLSDTTSQHEQEAPYQEIQKVVSFDRNNDDRFGQAVAISGNYAVVTANHEDEDENNENLVVNGGAAYIYKYNGQHWESMQKIVPPDRAHSESYGTSVEIDGTTIALGGPLDGDDVEGENWSIYAGSVTLFEKGADETWHQTQKLTPLDRDMVDLFGQDIAISGNWMAISALGTDLDPEGLNPVMNAGGVYLYERDNQGSWVFRQKLIASDRDIDDFLGFSLAMDGKLLIVGAPVEDHDELGGNSMDGAGSVYIYERDIMGTWHEIQKIVATDRSAEDQFGDDVQIENGFIVIGASGSNTDESGGAVLGNAGAAYIFRKDVNGNWLQHQKIVSSQRKSGGRFGAKLAIDNNRLVIASSYDDKNELGTNRKAEAGLIHVYELNDSDMWVEKTKLASSDRDEYDRFGHAVDIYNGWIISSAVDEDEDENGLNTMTSAGSVYFFQEQIQCTPSLDSLTEVACVSYTSPSGSFEWTSSGIYRDTLIKLGGCDSILLIDLTIAEPVNGVDIQRTCQAYTWIDGITYTESTNAPTFTLSGSAVNGCDSIVRLDLVINEVNTNTDVNGSIINSMESEAGYQWLDCDNAMSPIPGETNQTFTAFSTGNYAVEVTKKGCVDTSACVPIMLVNVQQQSFDDSVVLSPNPARESVNLNFSKTQKELDIRLLSVTGQLIKTYLLQNADHIRIPLNQPGGLYFIELEDEAGHQRILKLILQ